MPTPFTSTFASAAAGSNGDNTANKRDSGPGDWYESPPQCTLQFEDNLLLSILSHYERTRYITGNQLTSLIRSRRPNGATHTFRRTSTNTTSQARDSAQPSTTSTNSGVYIPPHLNSNHPSHPYRNGTFADTRYGKEQLLDIFQNQRDSGGLDKNLQDLFLGTWDPITDNDSISAASRGDPKDQYPGPEVCWDYGAGSTPFGLAELTEDEKQVRTAGSTVRFQRTLTNYQLFTTSVNAPVKPTQNAKDGGGSTTTGARKASLSGYSTTTGNSSRPGTRRRDTSESFGGGPLSPSENKSFFRNEPNTATPPPALLRRRTDFKDEEPSPEPKDMSNNKDEQAESQAPFGSLRRVGTAPSNAPMNASSASPWSAGPTASAFGSMGSFGSFNVGPTTQNQESSEKRPGFGSARGSSRFKDLLSKTSAEDVMTRDKGGFIGLEKLPEEDTANPIQSNIRDVFKTRPNRSETNPYEDAPPRAGSAALSSSQEEQSIGQMGFASLTGGSGFGQADSFHQATDRFNHPMSPTNTNPYQSPQGNNHQRDVDEETNDSASQPLPPFGSGRRNLFSESDDRSSLGSRSNFGGLPGFGALGGPPTWSAAGLSNTTTARERSLGSSAFGDPIFSPLTEMQSPGASFFGGGPFGSVGRSNRLGAMFPPAMQDQMRGGDDAPVPGFGSRPESAQQTAAARDPFDNNFARSSGAFDEGSIRALDEPVGAFGPPGQTNAAPPTNPNRSSTGSEPGIKGQPSSSDNGNQMPAAQQRQMVMPDRMRWIYRDPQGTIQGPWSGLEMHDWFKAGFFTAELLVKKVEDAEFEPLAQLVRRIGNSREPFLVPQIGVPHGPTSGVATNWPNAPTAPAQPGNAQPPFASAFPSFGTTLTAEQQNALERRKQEEQYLMARQKEHLAQQQAYMKQMQIQSGPHAMHSLQHHSSAQSLHSQPSFGSITSPQAFHPSPLPTSGGTHHQQMGPPPSSQPQPSYSGRGEETHSMMDRLSFNERMNLAPGGGALGAPGDQSPQVTQMLQDRARLQQQQQQQGVHQEPFLGQPGRNDRLEEFNDLRGQDDGRSGLDQVLQPIGAPRLGEEHKPPGPIGHPGSIQKPSTESSEPPSLTQQVQWTTAHKEHQPIQPPPVSISPLPAPAAQRNRQGVADALVQEPMSDAQTPVETPASSLAPWAERSNEATKGPSLKEIQAAEAKKAAEQEALAAEARRVQVEQERLAQSHAPPPAPGLPATSTWGQSGSPGTPTTPGASVWSKQNTKPGAGPPPSAKKTLAQIQKEEEVRKQRATATAAATANAQSAASPVSAGATGKRYAELASKAVPAPQVSSNTGNAWTTVGSGGKAKIPATIVATPQTAPRSVSSTASAQAKTRPTLQTNRSSNVTEKSKAHEEFTKWLKGQLGKGLNSGINGKQ